MPSTSTIIITLPMMNDSVLLVGHRVHGFNKPILLQLANKIIIKVIVLSGARGFYTRYIYRSLTFEAVHVALLENYDIL